MMTNVKSGNALTNSMTTKPPRIISGWFRACCVGLAVTAINPGCVTTTVDDPAHDTMDPGDVVLQSPEQAGNLDGELRRDDDD